MISFFNNMHSLWVCVIKAIHEEDGHLSMMIPLGTDFFFVWIVMLCSVMQLRDRGIDLEYFVLKMRGIIDWLAFKRMFCEVRLIWKISFLEFVYLSHIKGAWLVIVSLLKCCYIVCVDNPIKDGSIDKIQKIVASCNSI